MKSLEILNEQTETYHKKKIEIVRGLKDSINDYLDELEVMLGIKFDFRIAVQLGNVREGASRKTYIRIEKRCDDKRYSKIIYEGRQGQGIKLLLTYQQGIADVYKAVRLRDEPEFRKINDKYVKRRKL